MEFTKKEINHLAIAIFVLGVIFSFKEWGAEEFSLLYGIKNLLRAIIISSIILLTQIYTEKWVGKKLNISVFYTLWVVEPFFVFKHFVKDKVYLGVIVPLLLSLASNGALTLPIVGGFSSHEDQSKRIGRRFSRLTEFEEGRISFIGMISNLLWIIIFKVLTLTGLPFFDKGMEIGAFILMINILPLPPLNGSKIFFGSRSFYVFSLIFMVASVICLYTFSIIVSLIIAAVTAIIISVLYYHHKEYSQ